MARWEHKLRQVELDTVGHESELFGKLSSASRDCELRSKKAQKKKSLVINTQGSGEGTHQHPSSPFSWKSCSLPHEISTTVTYSQAVSVQIMKRKPTRNYNNERSDQKNPKNIYFRILNRSFFLLNDFTCLQTPRNATRRCSASR